MILSYKICIYPNVEQTRIIERTMGACRWIYNDFLRYNKELRDRGEKRVSGQKYSKKLTVWKQENDKYSWLNEISSKAIHESFMDADEAYRRFRKGISGFPRFKSKKKNPVNSYFFVGDNVRFTGLKVVLPILGKVRITERHYVPQHLRVIGGTIKKENDKYYAIFRIERDEEDLKIIHDHTNIGYGIDVGISKYATVISSEFKDKFNEIRSQYPDDMDIDRSFIIEKVLETDVCREYDTFIHDPCIVQAEKKIKMFQEIISKKMEINYGVLLNKFLDTYHTEPTEKEKNKMKGISYSNRCDYIQKKINRLQEYIRNYKKNKIIDLVNELVRLKPAYFTIEDLSVKNLLENNAPKKLHVHIQDSKFRFFFAVLEYKSHINTIEVRQTDRYYASSKTCCMCERVNKKLKLSDRTFKCPYCGSVIPRDANAGINEVYAKEYEVLKNIK